MWKRAEEIKLPSWLSDNHGEGGPSSSSESPLHETTPLLTSGTTVNTYTGPSSPADENDDATSLLLFHPESTITQEHDHDDDEEEESPFQQPQPRKHKHKHKQTNTKSRLSLRRELHQFSCIGCCHDMFLLISTAAILCNFSLLLGQILATIYVHSDTLQICLRIYVGLFCIVFIGIEMDWILTRNLASNFIVRGILYSFLGLIGVEQSIALRVDMLHLSHVSSMWAQIASVLLHLAAWAMVCMGGLYFVLGVLCLQPLRDKVAEEERKRVERIKKRWEDAVLEDHEGGDSA